MTTRSRTRVLIVTLPSAHDSYYPVPDGPDSHPALLTYQTAS